MNFNPDSVTLLQAGDQCGQTGRPLTGLDLVCCATCQSYEGGVLGWKPGTMNRISCAHPGSRKVE